MIVFLLTAVLIADGGGAQTSEDSCDPHELKVCVDTTPRTQIGLPRTKEELDKHCLLDEDNGEPLAQNWGDVYLAVDCNRSRCHDAYYRHHNILRSEQGSLPPNMYQDMNCVKTLETRAYQTGMSCMDAWIKRCLPTDGQKLVQQQIGGARALMRYLCSNDTALRRDFLKEPSCWSMVSPDWSHCVDELQLAAREISERSHHIVYFNKNTEMCCARDAFVSCVGHAGRACSSTAGALLRRMAWVLAQDVAACSRAGQQLRVTCAAPRPPRLSALLSLLYYIYYI